MADPRRERGGTDGPATRRKVRIPVRRGSGTGRRAAGEEPGIEGEEPAEPGGRPPGEAAGGETAETDDIPEETEEMVPRDDFDHLKDRLVRLQAEFDNYRKRQARDFRRLSYQGKREVLQELLVVLDNFDRAESHMEEPAAEGPEEVARGLMQTVNQLRGILKSQGLSEMDVRRDDPFDPTIHEAMMARQVEGIDGDKVMEVLQKGYLLNEELLRPARVVVGKPQEDARAAEPEAGEPDRPEEPDDAEAGGSDETEEDGDGK